MTQKFRSFSNRLTQRIVYAVFLTMGFIAVISFFTARNVMISETEARYFSIMHLINEKIEKSLVEYVVAARNVRYEMEQRLDSPEAVMTTLNPIGGTGSSLISSTVETSFLYSFR